MSGKRTITPETEAAVVAAYGSGERSGEIAKRFGINRKTVTTIVKRNGAEVLSQQIASGVRPKDTTPLHPEIVRLRGEGLSQAEIAKRVGVSQALVSRALARSGLPTKDTRTGPAHPAWRGGVVDATGGYRARWVSTDDPMSSMRNRMGYVLEHRLEVARALGRPLSRTETVHHINGDKLDNRIGNLQLRQGRHGAGAAFACLDCGSHNVGPVPIKDAPQYQCAGCGHGVRAVGGGVVRECGCDAAVIANLSATVRRPKPKG